MKLPHAWIKPLARAGYGARGLIYTIIGLFALLAAFGAGAKQNSQGALQKLLHQPLGDLMVWLMVGGLLGYVLWRLIQALFDTDDHGLGPKGLAVRGALLVSAFTYGSLASFALSRLGVLSPGDERPVADTLASFVGKDTVAAVLALCFAGAAAAHFWKAARRKYAKHLEADEDTMRILHPISITGLTARGLVFAIGSLLLIYRFFQASGGSSKPPGVKDALAFVQDMPAGGLLLALMGLGLMAFAAYSFAQAGWRRINSESA